MLVYLACGVEVPSSEVLFIRWSLNPLDRRRLSSVVDKDSPTNFLKWGTILEVLQYLVKLPSAELLFIIWLLNPLDRRPSSVVDMDSLTNILKWGTIVKVFLC